MVKTAFLNFQKLVRFSLFSSHLTADPIEVDACVEARGNSDNSKPPVFLLKYGENCLFEFPKTRETFPLSFYLTADPIRVNDCVDARGNSVIGRSLVFI
jgi:hypothetical protein